MYALKHKDTGDLLSFDILNCCDGSFEVELDRWENERVWTTSSYTTALDVSRSPGNRNYSSLQRPYNPYFGQVVVVKLSFDEV